MPLRPSYVRRDSTSSSECSDNSYHSRSTAPTDYSHHRPSLRKYETDISRWRAERMFEEEQEEDEAVWDCSDPRASAETYASTVPSEVDDDEYPVFEDLPDYQYEAAAPTAYASTPPEFAELFPSTRRLCIRHDDTIDGNMNLRLDTETHTAGGRRVDLTLFHLRMHDLKNRDFSLRRYCRESGREVCHTSRKYTKPASERRPGLQRSMSNALATLKSKSESRNWTKTSLKRTDSGYESMSDHGDDAGFGNESQKSSSANGLPIPTNTTNIEFSNYAHVDLKRRGTKSSKRYEFEYWGVRYSWKRVAGKRDSAREASYHLYNTESGSPVAHIVPVPMTPAEAWEEEQKGGWVPPCSMWVSDARILGGLTDVADVIVATGLMAFVDDCIKNKWHRKDRFHFPIPLPSLSKKVDYIGPKRLIDEVFNRRSTNATRPSPLRQIASTKT